MPRTTWSKWLFIGSTASKSAAERIKKAQVAKGARSGLEVQVRITRQKSSFIGTSYAIELRDRFVGRDKLQAGTESGR